MKEKELLNEFEATINELKILISSFNPDKKLAELLKQATLEAHKESQLHDKLNVIHTTLVVIALLVILMGVGGALFVWGLAE